MYKNNPITVTLLIICRCDEQAQIGPGKGETKKKQTKQRRSVVTDCVKFTWRAEAVKAAREKIPDYY